MSSDDGGRRRVRWSRRTLQVALVRSTPRRGHEVCRAFAWSVVIFVRPRLWALAPSCKHRRVGRLKLTGCREPAKARVEEFDELCCAPDDGSTGRSTEDLGCRCWLDDLPDRAQLVEVVQRVRDGRLLARAAIISLQCSRIPAAGQSAGGWPRARTAPAGSA